MSESYSDCDVVEFCVDVVDLAADEAEVWEAPDVCECLDALDAWEVWDESDSYDSSSVLLRFDLTGSDDAPETPDDSVTADVSDTRDVPDVSDDRDT